MKALLGLIVFVASNAHALPVPPLHKMSCWDHTFAYNRLEVVENQGRVELEISGQNMAIFTQLTGVTGWGQLVLRTHFEPGVCRTSPGDAKLLSCAAEEIVITVEDSSIFGRPPQTRTIVLKHAAVAVRKVIEAGMNFNELDSTHYELTIQSHDSGDVTQFTQKYAHGLTIDATDNCALK
ncbi:MAG: hypothetical protein V4760_05655 [Bdellovibrionota bacterium]